MTMTTMRLGDLLVAAKLTSPNNIETAMARQIAQGGRLGDNLVELGFIDRGKLAETVLGEIVIRSGDRPRPSQWFS